MPDLTPASLAPGETGAAPETEAAGWSVPRLLDALARQARCDRSLLARAVGRQHLSDGAVALRRLVSAGFIDRLSARAVLHVSEGRLDERELRQLLAAHRLPARLAGLADDSAETPTEVRRLAVGESLGRFVVKGQLGRGGSSRVYLALHPTLRVSVALKVPLRPDSTAAGRLRAEAATLARVAHPNVVRVWDADQSGGVPFLVLEYIDGEGLEATLRRTGRLPVSAALRAARDAVRGLRAAHCRGVLHRDVKPANLLRTLDGVAKVADFGSSRVAAGLVEGTWGYAAPERFAGEGDHRADIYSLGLTLYHLLGGSPAVPGTDFRECRDRQKRLTLEPLHWSVPGVGPQVDEVIRRMTAREPAGRFADYDQVLTALRAVSRRPT